MKGGAYMKTLFYGGKILTMQDALYAEALLTEDDRILAVGNREQLERQAGECQKIDLDGATLMPGFIDPHSHFFQVATSLLRVPLEGLDNIGDIRDAVQRFIREHHVAPGQWVNGRDYDNNIMPGYQNPTIEELDAICPDNPMVIHFIYRKTVRKWRPQNRKHFIREIKHSSLRS